MKKLVLLTSLALIALSNLAVAQIPNSGFETWTSMGSYSNPAGWGTMNNTTTPSSVYTATKGTPGSPGTAYLKLTSKTVLSNVVNAIAVSGKLDSITMQPISGFAFTLRPQKFTGKWQHMSAADDGSISIKLTRWNTSTNSRETVATANRVLGTMAMSWATFTINFVYQTGNAPDTCIIVLKASGTTPVANDYLWVDNLSFTGSVSGTGIESNNNFLNSLVVYPNPSSSTIIIDLNLKSSEKTTFELTDLIGKIILSKTVSLPQGESTQTFDISGLAKGSYFIKINTESGSETRKIIVE